MNSNMNNSRRIKVYENLNQAIDQQIAKSKSEEPIYIVNVDSILQSHANWLAKMPRVKPFYAVKCNTQPIMIETLAALGCNFDCASKGEINTVLACGVTADRIIYANPCKTRSYIRHAQQVGVDLMTFDNEDELHKISEIFPQARLVIRIKVDDSQSICKFSAKFGASVQEAYRLLEVAKKLQLNIVGVSFHVGSGCESAESFAMAIQDAKEVFQYALSLRFNMQILDLGGGYPGTSNAKVTFDEISSVISHALDQYFPANLVDDLQIIAEPGRYYAARAFTLLTQVIAKRQIQYEEHEIIENLEQMQQDGLTCFGRNGQIVHPKEDCLADSLMAYNIDYRRGVMYYLNDGVYGSFNCTIFDHWTVDPMPYPVMPAADKLGRVQLRPESDSEQYLNTVLWGPTCDSMDMIRRSIYLPELQIGDWIVFPEMGAYTIAAASTFNGFPIPSLHYMLTSYSFATLKTLSAWPRLKHLLTLKTNSKSSSSNTNNSSIRAAGAAVINDENQPNSDSNTFIRVY